jgi:hypothetical protein
MKRDLDLIREILLHIESGEQYDGTREFYYSSPEDMGLSSEIFPRVVSFAIRNRISGEV